MKNIKSFDFFVNEGIRDKMTPKSKEDIKKSLENSSALTILNGIKTHELNDVYTDVEIKDLRNRAKKYLNRLPIDDRVEKIFNEIELHPLSIYSEIELKRLISQIDGLENQLEKISNHELFHLYTKDELKDIVNSFYVHERFGIIHNYGMTDIFTKEEIEKYIQDSDERHIRDYFRSMVKNNKFDEVKELYKGEIRFHNGDYMLVGAAIDSGNLEMVKYLVEKGMPITYNFEQLFSKMLQDADKDVILFILSKSPELQQKLEEKKRMLKRDTEVLEKYS